MRSLILALALSSPVAANHLPGALPPGSLAIGTPVDVHGHPSYCVAIPEATEVPPHMECFGDQSRDPDMVQECLDAYNDGHVEIYADACEAQGDAVDRWSQRYDNAIAAHAACTAQCPPLSPNPTPVEIAARIQCLNDCYDQFETDLGDADNILESDLGGIDAQVTSRQIELWLEFLACLPDCEDD